MEYAAKILFEALIDRGRVVIDIGRFFSQDGPRGAYDNRLFLFFVNNVEQFIQCGLSKSSRRKREILCDDYLRLYSVIGFDKQLAPPVFKFCKRVALVNGHRHFAGFRSVKRRQLDEIHARRRNVTLDWLSAREQGDTRD